MTIEQTAALIEEFLARYCTNTRNTYRGDFKAFASALNTSVPAAVGRILWDGPRTRERLVRRYVNARAKWSHATINRRLRTLHSICLYAQQQRLLKEEVQFTYPPEKGPEAERRPQATPPKPLSVETVRRIRAAIARDRATAGKRDLALFDLLYLRNLSGREIVRLEIGDFDVNTGRITTLVRRTRKFVRLSLQRRCLESLRAWLEHRPPASTKHLFVRVRGRLKERLTSTSLNIIIKRRAKEAGIAERVNVRRLSLASAKRPVWHRMLLRILGRNTR